MMTLRERISQELLPQVRQPGQYIGGEWNQLVKPGDWQRAEVRVAVAFPDTYAIGMSHLGSQILYWLCNHTPGVCAERVYAPWLDAERVMRRRGIPLFTWDTRQPVADADILAVSLQYELAFTNLLMMLDLAGIPLRSDQRSDRHPLVIAGGPQADNPEPVADFLDLVVVGDGEHSMPVILEICRQMKRARASRRDTVLEMTRRCEWIYAPSLYAFDYCDDATSSTGNTTDRGLHTADRALHGTIRAVRPSGVCPPDFPLRTDIARCSTPDFETTPFPARPLVPYTQVVHDRISVEIMRGCPQRCRFCHAGYTRRPLRWRSADRILDIAEQAWRATGHEEIGLLSLSTADYPKLGQLAERINERFRDRHVSLSVPSLRVDKMLADVPWMVSSVRKSGLTIAVEAAKADLRAAIRKKVTDGDLIDGVKQAYRAGWNSVKLYFLCGLPGEGEEDITAIARLAREVSEAKRGIRGGPAAVTASVSWLVPKPYTPFQWAAQQTLDYFNHVRDILVRAVAGRRCNVRIKTHRAERSILEGVFARGDRRLAPAIETAYRLGARMDAWDEAFDYDLWLQAFDRTGIDPGFYAHRERDYNEILPWDHIAGADSRRSLQTQYDDVFAKINVPRPPVAV